MSGVRRFEAHYLTEGVMGGKALAVAQCVLASDYDACESRLHEVAEVCAIAEQERDELRVQVAAMLADSDLYRQWFNAVQDCSPLYLERKDYGAAIRLLERLGMRVPLSVVAGAAMQATP